MTSGDDPHRRLPRDEYFMGIARLASRRSTCLHRNVGAVVVSTDNRLLSTGYNGPPAGFRHCLDVGCARDDILSGTQLELCRALHAEMNAILEALKSGGYERVKGGTLYTTHYPCPLCARFIAATELRRVCYGGEYASESGISDVAEGVLQEAKVTKILVR